MHAMVTDGRVSNKLPQIVSLSSMVCLENVLSAGAPPRMWGTASNTVVHAGMIVKGIAPLSISRIAK